MNSDKNTTSGDDKPPQTYLGVARQMIPGAVLLADNPEVSAHAFALVSAHVLECLFKAYLTRGGDDVSAKAVKKSDIRHDIEKLWLRAVGEGLSIDASPPHWALLLSDIHANPFHLRYSTGINGIVLPPIVGTRDGLLGVMEAVESSM